MSFSRTIQIGHYLGVPVARVTVPLTVAGSSGPVLHDFRFDTGCDISTVSEDVAALLGLPPGGAAARITGSTGTAPGRLVPVTFQFPPDEFSNRPEPDVSSMWIVTPGQTGLALLSFHDVHAYFSVGTDDTFMHFANR